VVAHRHAFRYHRLAPGVAGVPDPRGRVLVRRAPARHRPLDGVVAVDLDTARDGAVVADREAAGSVQEREWADPGVATDGDLAEDVARVVDARPLGETERPCALPAVGEQLSRRQVAVPARAHLAAQPVEDVAELVLEGRAHASASAARAPASPEGEPVRS